MKTLVSNRGQALTEVILITFVVLALASGVTKVLRENGTLQKIFGDSWARLNNTIEYGVPTNNRAEASKNLPGTQARITTRVVE